MNCWLRCATENGPPHSSQCWKCQLMCPRPLWERAALSRPRTRLGEGFSPRARSPWREPLTQPSLLLASLLPSPTRGEGTSIGSAIADDQSGLMVRDAPAALLTMRVDQLLLRRLAFDRVNVDRAQA